MRHVSPQEMVDLADGAASEPVVRHVAGCARCREQVESLRGMLTEAARVEVPEPSPLFWEHFTARVRDAVAAEPIPERGWAGAWNWRPWAAVAVVTLLVGMVTLSREPQFTTPGADTSVTVTGPSETLMPSDDASLGFVGDLMQQVDLETAVDAGFRGEAGVVDRVLAELSAEERVELQRLLQEALSGAGV